MKLKLTSLIICAAAMLLSQGVICSAQVKPTEIVPVESMPDVTRFLQQPPVGGSVEFLRDSSLYRWGQAARETERGKLAIEDASLSINYFLSRFGAAMEIDASLETHPHLAEYVLSVLTNARRALSPAKDAYKRMRPYQYFGEPSSVPHEEKANDLTSFPSGHSVRAWAIALALVTIDPDHQDAIFETGYQICRSRVIAGFHYQSDIEAAMICASAFFARMCYEPAFQELRAAALDEISTKKQQ